MRVLPVVSLVSLLAVACAGPSEASSKAWAISARERWEFTDPDAWLTGFGLGNVGGLSHFYQFLQLDRPSDYKPPHRSPLSLAILRDVEFEDFDLTVEALSTKEEYGHRDLLIVFAHRDPAHFAYAHLASKADQNAHHVMLVDGAPRRPVSTDRTEGVVWGADWHDLRLTRRGETVEVFFDEERVITATVPAGPGRVGLGSFDDTGIFRRLTVTPR